MIVCKLTESQERNLRVEYVNSPQCNLDDFNGYARYTEHSVPGVICATYKGGDNPHYMETLTFDEEQHLIWFIVRYS